MGNRQANALLPHQFRWIPAPSYRRARSRWQADGLPERRHARCSRNLARRDYRSLISLQHVGVGIRVGVSGRDSGSSWWRTSTRSSVKVSRAGNVSR